MSDIQERLNELDRALEQLRMPLDVMQRLHNAEQAINRMQARQDQAEADIIDGNEEMLDRIKIVDIARARGNEGQHDLVTRTANAIYAEIKKLEQRISDCELAVGTDTLDPEPPVDTSWHPFNFSTDLRPDDDKHVVVMDRSGEISGPWQADLLNWCEENDATIIAWRYAKEGE